MIYFLFQIYNTVHVTICISNSIYTSFVLHNLANSAIEEICPMEEISEIKSEFREI